jgi:putative membrane protein
MSRKPTVVSLSDPEEKPEEKPAPSKSKPATKKPTQSKKETPRGATRKPRAMDAPDPTETVDVFDPDSDDYLEDIPNHIPAPTKRNKLRVLFFACLSALVSLGIGLWITQVIEDLFARHEWLGWGASALLAIVIFCLVVIVLREVMALWRLRKLGRLREGVMRALEDKSVSGSKTLDQIVTLYQDRKEMHWHISKLASHNDDVMDGRDRLLLAEQMLMKPLDDEARQIIATASKRIAVVTAINPAASLDVIFTGYQVLRMLRQLTALYGNRPGSIGTLKLAGMVGSHLAVTGGLALSDTLLQQFIGKGLAGRLSAKLGEGTVNGIMTARIGLAALDLCRPMPFNAVERPGLKAFLGTIAGSVSSKDQADGAS